MVIYKYVEDYFQDDPDAESFCKRRNIVYFPPTDDRELRLQGWLKTVVLPKIESDPDVICYWRSYGTWGMYHPDDNSISICPFEIDRAGGLENVIRHELKHLQHPEADELPHEAKEKVINDN